LVGFRGSQELPRTKVRSIAARGLRGFCNRCWRTAITRPAYSPTPGGARYQAYTGPPRAGGPTPCLFAPLRPALPTYLPVSQGKRHTWRSEIAH